MPIGEGFWLNAETLEKRDATEHIKEIKNNPEKYGFTKDQIKELDLDSIMIKGWIRGRSYRSRQAFQFNGDTKKCLDAIYLYGLKENFEPYYELNIENTAVKKHNKISWEDFKELYSQDNYEAILMQANYSCKKLSELSLEERNKLLNFFKET